MDIVLYNFAVAMFRRHAKYGSVGEILLWLVKVENGDIFADFYLCDALLTQVLAMALCLSVCD